jgi:hypothetical protein
VIFDNGFSLSGHFLHTKYLVGCNARVRFIFCNAWCVYNCFQLPYEIIIACLSHFFCPFCLPPPPRPRRWKQRMEDASFRTDSSHAWRRPEVFFTSRHIMSLAFYLATPGITVPLQPNQYLDTGPIDQYPKYGPFEVMILVLNLERMDKVLCVCG